LLFEYTALRSIAIPLPSPSSHWVLLSSSTRWRSRCKWRWPDLRQARSRCLAHLSLSATARDLRDDTG
jgi:hypothetical protein